MRDPCIRERGEVVRLEGALALVEIPRSSACAGCAAQGVCHSLSSSDHRILRAVNGIQADLGDRVEVEIQTAAAVRAAAWVYAVPTLIMVVAALAAHHLASGRMDAGKADMVTALAALGALAAFILGALLWRRLRPPGTRGYPVVTRRL